MSLCFGDVPKWLKGPHSKCGRSAITGARVQIPPSPFNVLSESFLHLLLWLISRQSHPNFINVRTAYVSKIWAQLTKNLLTKSSTKRFREYILFYYNLMFCGSQSQNTVRACTIRRLTLGPWCHIKIISQLCRISNLKLNIMNVLYLFYLKKGK